MASAAAAAKRLVPLLGAVTIPAILTARAYGVTAKDLPAQLLRFFSGPGSKSRIIALILVLLNWKGLPFAWTFRVLNAMVQHIMIRRAHSLPYSALFHPIISKSHATLLECDYNIHKSNSTYFADLDVTRSHLVSLLTSKAINKLGNNAKTRLVMDPSNPSKVAKGRFSVMLGAVECSFKREIKPYQGYECWTRLLFWDRKWMYMVSYFVEAGAIKPRSWDSGPGFGPTRKASDQRGPEDWEKKIFASAISKYVFKMGRLTIHPAVVLEASDILPARPGGWTSTDATSTDLDLPKGLSDGTSTWDWVRVEKERRKGAAYAENFATLDDLQKEFDAGDQGALGRFNLG